MRPTLEEAFPLFGLSLRLGDLVLRVARDEDVLAQSEIVHRLLAEDQKHFMPRLMLSVGDTVAETAGNLFCWVWRRRSSLSSQDWSISMAVINQGTVVGMQAMAATGYPTLRDIHTGSYLDPDVQGQGIGTRMRAMVLELAFAHLGALSVSSGWTEGNESSKRVSEKLGYLADGIEADSWAKRRHLVHKVRLPLERWAVYRPSYLDQMVVTGLEPVLPLLDE